MKPWGPASFAPDIPSASAVDTVPEPMRPRGDLVRELSADGVGRRRPEFDLTVPQH